MLYSLEWILALLKHLSNTIHSLPWEVYWSTAITTPKAPDFQLHLWEQIWEAGPQSFSSGVGRQKRSERAVEPGLSPAGSFLKGRTELTATWYVPYELCRAFLQRSQWGLPSETCQAFWVRITASSFQDKVCSRCERYYHSRSILSKNVVLQLYHQKVSFSTQCSMCLNVREDAEKNQLLPSWISIHTIRVRNKNKNKTKIITTNLFCLTAL